MTIELGAIISIMSACVAVGAFFISRMKDAEERGALKQRVKNLEEKQTVQDAKIDRILDKLDALALDIRSLMNDHVKDLHGAH